MCRKEPRRAGLDVTHYVAADEHITNDIDIDRTVHGVFDTHVKIPRIVDFVVVAMAMHVEFPTQLIRMDGSMREPEVLVLVETIHLVVVFDNSAHRDSFKVMVANDKNLLFCFPLGKVFQPFLSEAHVTKTESSISLRDGVVPVLFQQFILLFFGAA